MLDTVVCVPSSNTLTHSQTHKKIDNWLVSEILGLSKNDHEQKNYQSFFFGYKMLNLRKKCDILLLFGWWVFKVLVASVDVFVFCNGDLMYLFMLWLVILLQCCCYAVTSSCCCCCYCDADAVLLSLLFWLLLK